MNEDDVVISRHGSTALTSYLGQIKDEIYNLDGDKLAVLISIERFGPPNEIYEQLKGSGRPWENVVTNTLEAPWDEMIRAHLLTYQTLWQNPTSYSAAFKHKCTVMQSLVRLATQTKENNWMLPIMYVNAVELRKLAILADEHYLHYERKNDAPNAKTKINEHLEEAASQLMNCFRTLANDARTAIEYSKRLGMLAIVNQLFRIYFIIHKMNLYKPLVRAIDNANITQHFSLAQRVTFSYYTGIKFLFDSIYSRADKTLSFAFENCNPKYPKNRRLILIYLITAKLLHTGFMPRAKILDDFNLPEFRPLCNAIKEGNLYEFDQAIEQNADFFYHYGIYFSLEKSKTLVFRNIFKKVASLVNTHQISLELFVSAINYFQSNRGQIQLDDEEVMEMPEVHCLLANLISENKLKGYISLQHQKLVISKKDPFPNISTDE